MMKQLAKTFLAILCVISILSGINCHNPKKDSNMNDAYEQVNPNNCNTGYSRDHSSGNKKDSAHADSSAQPIHK